MAKFTQVPMRDNTMFSPQTQRAKGCIDEQRILTMFHLSRASEDVTEVCKTHGEVPCKMNIEQDQNRSK